MLGAGPGWAELEQPLEPQDERCGWTGRAVVAAGQGTTSVPRTVLSAASGRTARNGGGGDPAFSRRV